MHEYYTKDEACGNHSAALSIKPSSVFKKKVLFFLVLFFISVQFPNVHVFADESPVQKVVRKGDDIIVSFRYKQNLDMHLVLGRSGINSIFNISRIYLEYNKSDDVSPWISPRAYLFMETGTDWIGPYAVKALNGSSETYSRFTGGWHGTKGDTTGLPTAKTESISAVINGIELKDGVPYEGDLTVKSTNYIQAYNAKKQGDYVIKETVTYRVSPGKIFVDLDSTALEDIHVDRYFGLQTFNKSWQGGIEYGNGITADVNKSSCAGPRGTDNMPVSFSLKSLNGYYSLKCSIEAGYGLATFENISESESTIFTESYGKTYFNLISKYGKEIKKGGQIKWKGSYEFG